MSANYTPEQITRYGRYVKSVPIRNNPVLTEGFIRSRLLSLQKDKHFSTLLFLELLIEKTAFFASVFALKQLSDEDRGAFSEALSAYFRKTLSDSSEVTVHDISAAVLVFPEAKYAEELLTVYRSQKESQPNEDYDSYYRDIYRCIDLLTRFVSNKKYFYRFLLAAYNTLSSVTNCRVFELHSESVLYNVDDGKQWLLELGKIVLERGDQQYIYTIQNKFKDFRISYFGINAEEYLKYSLAQRAYVNGICQAQIFYQQERDETTTAYDAYTEWRQLFLSLIRDESHPEYHWIEWYMDWFNAYDLCMRAVLAPREFEALSKEVGEIKPKEETLRCSDYYSQQIQTEAFEKLIEAGDPSAILTLIRRLGTWNLFRFSKNQEKVLQVNAVINSSAFYSLLKNDPRITVEDVCEIYYHSILRSISDYNSMIAVLLHIRERDYSLSITDIIKALQKYPFRCKMLKVNSFCSVINYSLQRRPMQCLFDRTWISEKDNFHLVKKYRNSQNPTATIVNFDHRYLKAFYIVLLDKRAVNTGEPINALQCIRLLDSIHEKDNNFYKVVSQLKGCDISTDEDDAVMAQFHRALLGAIAKLGPRYFAAYQLLSCFQKKYFYRPFVKYNKFSMRIRELKDKLWKTRLYTWIYESWSEVVKAGYLISDLLDIYFNTVFKMFVPLCRIGDLMAPNGETVSLTNDFMVKNTNGAPMEMAGFIVEKEDGMYIEPISHMYSYDRYKISDDNVEAANILRANAGDICIFTLRSYDGKKHIFYTDSVSKRYNFDPKQNSMMQNKIRQLLNNPYPDILRKNIRTLRSTLRSDRGFYWTQEDYLYTIDDIFSAVKVLLKDGSEASIDSIRDLCDILESCGLWTYRQKRMTFSIIRIPVNPAYRMKHEKSCTTILNQLIAIGDVDLILRIYFHTPMRAFTNIMKLIGQLLTHELIKEDEIKDAFAGYPIELYNKDDRYLTDKFLLKGVIKVDENTPDTSDSRIIVGVDFENYALLLE